MDSSSEPRAAGIACRDPAPAHLAEDHGRTRQGHALPPPAAPLVTAVQRGRLFDEFERWADELDGEYDLYRQEMRRLGLTPVSLEALFEESRVSQVEPALLLRRKRGTKTP